MLLSSPQLATVFRSTNSVIYISCDSLLCLLSVKLLYRFMYSTLFSAEACSCVVHHADACDFISPARYAKQNCEGEPYRRFGTEIFPIPTLFLCNSYADEDLMDWLSSHGNDGICNMVVAN